MIDILQNISGRRWVVEDLVPPKPPSSTSGTTAGSRETEFQRKRPGRGRLLRIVPARRDPADFLRTDDVPMRKDGMRVDALIAIRMS